MTNDTQGPSEGHSAPAVGPPDKAILCPCFDVTMADLRDTLAADPQIGFDEFLAATDAGSKCTACMLDLEYHFVSTPRPAAPKFTPARRRVATEDLIPLKQRLYRAIDALAPMTPFKLDNVMPIVAGPGIETWAWVTNWSMMFEGEDCAPETLVELVVRDGDGGLRHRQRESLAPESSLRVDVGRFLPSPADGDGTKPAIGSVEINRRSRHSGVRGTMRPQIEIIARSGGCAVHSQAASGPVERSFTGLHRPGDERLFLSLVSRSSRVMEVEIEYPILDPQPAGLPVLRRVERIRPFGARLHEIDIPEAYAGTLNGGLFTIRWRAPAPYKPHILCSTPNLDLFSIDHV